MKTLDQAKVRIFADGADNNAPEQRLLKKLSLVDEYMGTLRLRP